MDDESPSPYCGRLVQITNTGSDDGVGGAGNTLVVQVEDTCMSCGEGDIDLSVAAWNDLTDSAPWGTFDISWYVGLHPSEEQEEKHLLTVIASSRKFCNVDGQC